MPKRIAFVTCSTKSDFAGNDMPVVEVLRAVGIDVHPRPWDVDSTDWNSFDLVVIRSCWNYHLHPMKFIQWIDQMEKQKVKMFNPLKVVRWNLHKGYLKDLGSKGIALPETVWLNQGTQANLSSLMSEKNWGKAVVKPAISATAFNTFLISKEEADEQQKKFESLLSQADLLVQKFMKEVPEQGEWSLIFFNNKFSHAVIKKPAGEDFRVQNDFGGHATATNPPGFVLKQSEKILSLIDQPLLYARVDGVVSANRFLLMELELIEPMLFLEKEDCSAKAFGQAMINIIKNDN